MSLNENNPRCRCERSSLENRQSNSWWDNKFDKADDNAQPKVEIQYESGYELATLWPQGQADRFFLYTAPRNKSTGEEKEMTKRAFQAGVSRFVSERRQCHGQWSITLGSMALVDGSCGDATRGVYPRDWLVICHQATTYCAEPHFRARLKIALGLSFGNIRMLTMGLGKCGCGMRLRRVSLGGNIARRGCGRE